jgi:hypothetical protein
MTRLPVTPVTLPHVLYVCVLFSATVKLAGLNKWSSHITQPKSQGASQAMLYATGAADIWPVCIALAAVHARRQWSTSGIVDTHTAASIAKLVQQQQP